MRDYCFFFSYASDDRTTPATDSAVSDKNDYLRVFFDDLEREIKPAYRDGGFLDKQQFRGNWHDALIEGLATSRVLVPLYSQNYFRSRHCAKEWDVFHRRADENPKSGLDVTSNIILPVLWEIVTIPDEVRAYQYVTSDKYPDEYLQFGLYDVMRFKRNRRAYPEFLRLFKNQLKALANEQGTSKYREVPAFEDLYPPFPKKRTRGLKQVFTILVAGLKPQMKNRGVECYGTLYNRTDWRPCFPVLAKHALDIVSDAFASSHMIEIFEPPTDQNKTNDLLDELREARKRNNMVVLLVDPWSLSLPDFKPFIDALRSEGLPNAGVLMSWNLNAPDTSGHEDVLDAARKRFEGYFQQPFSTESDMRNGVRSAADFVRSKLVELGSIPPADNDVTEAKPSIGTKSSD